MDCDCNSGKNFLEELDKWKQIILKKYDHSTWMSLRIMLLNAYIIYSGNILFERQRSK